MVVKNRIEIISEGTAKLLREGESALVDFKRTSDSISVDDIVAFANSKNSGVILAGIVECSGVGGEQTGQVVGCEVSDAAILQIANKALACIPPVAIEFSIENLGYKPFLRIDIPSSSTKPHCTPKGVYCRRDGNRNRPLHPSELLAMFLESESRVFTERFETAADRITNVLAQLESNLDDSIRSMESQLGWADSKLAGTESTLDSILAYSQRLNAETNDLSARLRAIFRQDKRQDPIFERERKKLSDQVVSQLLEDRKLYQGIKAGKAISVSPKGKAAEELSETDFQQVFYEAVRIVGDQLDKKKYMIEVKKPSEVNDSDVAAIVKLIEEGGEVVHGVRPRLKRSHLLGLIRYQDQLVGTASLKNPASSYRNAVFKKAKASANPDDFIRELGWIFVNVDHRSKGQIQLLIEALLKAAGSDGLYATTRVANEKMQRILKHQGFVSHGVSFSSVHQANEMIALFIRP
jgi:GNAT superfamily N-acetyltransferase